MILTQRNMRSAVDHALNGLYKKFGSRDKIADSAATDDEMQNIVVFHADSKALVGASDMTLYYSLCIDSKRMVTGKRRNIEFLLSPDERFDCDILLPKYRNILTGAVIMRWTSETQPVFVVFIKDQRDA